MVAKKLYQKNQKSKEGEQETILILLIKNNRLSVKNINILAKKRQPLFVYQKLSLRIIIGNR